MSEYRRILAECKDYWDPNWTASIAQALPSLPGLHLEDLAFATLRDLVDLVAQYPVLESIEVNCVDLDDDEEEDQEPDTGPNMAQTLQSVTYVAGGSTNGIRPFFSWLKASHPRAFSQNFVLVDVNAAGQAAAAGETGGGVAVTSKTGKDGAITLGAKYVVQADSFRFVG